MSVAGATNLSPLEDVDGVASLSWTIAFFQPDRFPWMKLRFFGFGLTMTMFTAMTLTPKSCSTACRI